MPSLWETVLKTGVKPECEVLLIFSAFHAFFYFAWEFHIYNNILKIPPKIKFLWLSYLIIFQRWFWWQLATELRRALWPTNAPLGVRVRAHHPTWRGRGRHCNGKSVCSRGTQWEHLPEHSGGFWATNEQVSRRSTRVVFLHVQRCERITFFSRRKTEQQMFWMHSCFKCFSPTIILQEYVYT